MLSGLLSKYSMHGSSFSTPDHCGRFLNFKRGMPKMRRAHTKLTSAKSLDSEKCIWM